MSKVVRGVKNLTKGYSTVQVKVRNGMHCLLLYLFEEQADLTHQQRVMIHGGQRGRR